MYASICIQLFSDHNLQQVASVTGTVHVGNKAENRCGRLIVGWADTEIVVRVGEADPFHKLFRALVQFGYAVIAEE
jgi:hypothetical protein